MLRLFGVGIPEANLICLCLISIMQNPNIDAKQENHYRKREALLPLLQQIVIRIKLERQSQALRKVLLFPTLPFEKKENSCETPRFASEFSSH
ncbi:hypothetical protein JTB14_027279 [Gonioctena quinquepunctata]|nr:hypothetical protein JTB14_027279 [Gonioctena quinquepunctata]